jgi:hypothetical protein
MKFVIYRLVDNYIVYSIIQTYCCMGQRSTYVLIKNDLQKHHLTISFRE